MSSTLRNRLACLYREPAAHVRSMNGVVVQSLRRSSPGRPPRRDGTAPERDPQLTLRRLQPDTGLGAITLHALL